MANIFDLIPVSFNAGKLDSQLACCNDASKKYGLTLTREDMEALEQQHIELLKRTERVEFGQSSVVQLVEGFAASPYMQQDEYAENLEDLQEVFYDLRERAGADVFDEEIIDGMRLLFDGDAGGSVEMLANCSLDEILEAYDTQTGSLAEREREIIDYKGDALESTIPDAFNLGDDFGLPDEDAAERKERAGRSALRAVENESAQDANNPNNPLNLSRETMQLLNDLGSKELADSILRGMGLQVDENGLTGPDGQVYTWKPEEWEDDISADGWDGERWSDDL